MQESKKTKIVINIVILIIVTTLAIVLGMESLRALSEGNILAFIACALGVLMYGALANAVCGRIGYVRRGYKV